MQVPNSLSSPLQAASPPTPFVVGGGGGSNDYGALLTVSDQEWEA